MCGIVGYTGKALALSPVLEGLRAQVTPVAAVR